MKYLLSFCCKYLVMIVLKIIALPVYAQYENTTYEQRLGKGRDEKQNKELFAVWNNNYAIPNASIAAQNVQDMNVERSWNAESYATWFKLTRGEGRFAAFSLYSSGAAADMLRYLLYHEKDPAIKMLYLDDLVWLSDFRINHLQELNSIPKDNYGPPSKSTLADVKTWKAHFYYIDRKQLPERGYNPERAYQYFSEAMKEVRNQKNLAESEVKPYLLTEYFDACKELYVTDNNKHMEQFLQDFLECRNTCRKFYEAASEIQDTLKSKEQFTQYFSAYFHQIKVNFEAIFLKDGGDLTEAIENYYKAELENKKNNAAALNRAISLMLQFGCYPTADKPSILKDYANASWKDFRSDATYYTAWAYALNMKIEADNAMTDSTRTELRKEMLDAFKTAEDLAKTDEEKAEVFYQIAKALNRPIPGGVEDFVEEVEKWAEDIKGAIAYYKRSAELSFNRYGVASTYYIADIHSKLGNAYIRLYQKNKTTEIRHSIVDNLEECVKYFEQFQQDIETAKTKNIFEQDNTYLENFKPAADATLPAVKATLAQLNKKPAVQRVTTTTTVNRPVDPESDPTHKAYHDWLRKKLYEDQFWDPRATRTCPYCKRVFR